MCNLSLLCVLANRGRQRPGGQKERDQKDRMAHIHRRARRRGQPYLGEVHRQNGHQRLVLPLVSMDSVPATSCFHFLARVSILGGSASGRLCASLYEAYVALSSSYFACFSRRADSSIYTNAKKVYILENKELLTSDHIG